MLVFILYRYMHMWYAVIRFPLVFQCRMHKRRVDMLTRVLKPLNRQHYQLVCRQLLFELAETLSTMRDLKQEIHDEVSCL